MITLERHANPEMERGRFWTAEMPIGYITWFNRSGRRLTRASHQTTGRLKVFQMDYSRQRQRVLRNDAYGKYPFARKTKPFKCSEVEILFILIARQVDFQQ